MFLEKNRDRIEKDFEDFSRELPGKAEEIKKRMEALSPDIVIGMKYLYSNMPYSDVGNYTFDTYLDYVQQGIYLWENSPYVKNYPELYFLNYVLFHRTNDEEIKPCRICNKTENKEKLKQICSECIFEYYKLYRPSCEFRFNICKYPDEFDLSILEKNGWYKNKG